MSALSICCCPKLIHDMTSHYLLEGLSKRYLCCPERLPIIGLHIASMLKASLSPVLVERAASLF